MSRLASTIEATGKTVASEWRATVAAISGSPRLPRCRYLDKMLNRCTAEVVEPDGEIALCEHHLAAAMTLLHRRVGLTYQPRNE